MDVVDILGINRPSGQDDSMKMFLDTENTASKKSNKKTINKPKGMSRELFALMGPDGITPAIQTNQGNLFKDKRQHAMKGKWIWSSFRNSARSDDLHCSHWIKAELQAYDYTYAKFNVKIELISYKDHEYESLLQHPNWTKSETDHLLFLCYEYDLRWPVIADRYESSSSSPRPVEELMQRYYFIVSKLKSHRALNASGVSPASSATGGAPGQQTNTDFNHRNASSESFNIDYERARRKQQDLLFKKTPAEEAEEVKIREELKTIDAALKKLKKTSIKQSSVASDAQKASGATSATSASKASSTAAQPLSAANIISPPIMMYGGGVSSPDGHGLAPSPGFPCLQSARLSLHAEALHKISHPELSSSYVKKLVHLLQELGLPDRLIPTKRVCDANEQIRRDAAVLLSFQNAIQKREKELQSLKAYHESAGKKKDNSFLLPHVALLSNDVDPSLTEHFLLPSMIPLAEGGASGGAIPGPALGNPGKTTSKGHGRKSSSTGVKTKRKASSLSGGGAGEGETPPLADGSHPPGDGPEVIGPSVTPKPQASKRPRKQPTAAAAPTTSSANHQTNSSQPPPAGNVNPNPTGV